MTVRFVLDGKEIPFSDLSKITIRSEKISQIINEAIRRAQAEDKTETNKETEYEISEESDMLNR